MKKLFLLLAASSFALYAGAQERVEKSVVFNHASAVAHKNVHADGNSVLKGHSATEAAKTTNGPGGSRWYDYVDSIFALNTGSVALVQASGLNLWNDTTATDGYNNGSADVYYNSTFTSVGMSLNPYYSFWNDSTVFPGEIKIGATDAYVIDSIEVIGTYLRPVATPGAYHDSMRISLVYGNGSNTTDLPSYYFGDQGNPANFPYVPYGVDTLNFIDMLHDSLNNHAGVTTAPGSIQSFAFALTATDTATNFVKAYPVNLSVPALQYAAVSVGFKSGDVSYTPFDTVQYADGTVKHGEFISTVAFAANISGSATAWPPFDSLDQNVGYFKREGSGDAGWGGNYLPTWAWSATDPTSGATIASSLQYPVILFHVKCTTCALTTTHTTSSVAQVNNVTSVSVYPNPTNDELNVSFNVPVNGNVSVSLTNMVGQVVATKNMGNVNKGVAIFNTAALPAGVYIYLVNANGGLTTGHVVVAH